MSLHPFAGIYAALLTPLTPDGQLNAPAAQKLLLELTSQGLDGAYVAGTTGEGMRLSMEIRKSLVEAVLEVLPAGKRIFVHVGTPDVRDAIKLAEHAAAKGADAISSLPPALDSQQVMAFYKELAQHSPLPLLVYYFPKAAPLAFQKPQELLEICDLPNVLGVKFTDFNMYLLNSLAKRGKLVFNGYDEALAAGLLMGAQGGIGTTYNLLGPVYLDIYQAVQQGDWETARSLQYDANAVLDILFRYPFFPAVREAVRHMGIDCGPMASGEDFASDVQRKAFIQDMDANLPKRILHRIQWPVASGR
ncbi:dihydrodipicolinate synthase family protein [Terriglobus albidus]|uniref:dihydrodipicolinate synthase family protein n=1 Tax=Terriglobus albidus TaxID=1592106 RepID=UPI0021E0CCFF|nr:dihydrodipicolinate synthase family protein [Terriglobus albidus]